MIFDEDNPVKYNWNIYWKNMKKNSVEKEVFKGDETIATSKEDNSGKFQDFGLNQVLKDFSQEGISLVL